MSGASMASPRGDNPKSPRIGAGGSSVTTSSQQGQGSSATRTLKKDDQAVFSMVAWRNYLITRETSVVRVWNLDEGRHVKTWVMAARRITVSRDVLCVVSSAEEHTVVCFDLTAMNERRGVVLSGHSSYVSYVCLSASPLPLAIYTTSADNTAKKWVIPAAWPDSGSVKATVTFSGHTDYVLCSAVSGNGMTFYTGSCDTTLRKWNDKGHCLLEYRGHEGWVLQVELQEDRVLTSSQDGTVRLWNTTSADCARVFQVHQAILHMQVWGSKVYVADVSQRILELDLAPQGITREYLGHTARITSIEVEWQSHHIVSSSLDGTIRRWSPGRPTEPLVLDTGSEGVLCFARNGDMLYSGSQDGTILVWHLGLVTARRVGGGGGGGGIGTAAMMTSPRGNSAVGSNSVEVRRIIRCQALIRAKLARRALQKNELFFVGARERYKVARLVLIEESLHLRAVTDLMSFKKAFMEGHGHNTTDISMEHMFSLFVEMGALHALVVKPLSASLETSWPFIGETGALLLKHFERLLEMTQSYVTAYHVGLQKAKQQLQQSRTRAQLVKELELASGRSFYSLLELPFAYFSRQVYLLKPLVLHSQGCPDFPFLLDVTTRFEAAAWAISEVFQRMRNRAVLASIVEEQLPGVRVHVEMERLSIFTSGKPILLQGTAKTSAGHHMVLFLFENALVYGHPAKGLLGPTGLLGRLAKNEDHGVRDVLPLAECQLMKAPNPRSIALMLVGQKSLELHFASRELAQDWTAALARQIDVSRCRVFGLSLEALRHRDGSHVPWIVTLFCSRIKMAKIPIFELLLSPVDDKGLKRLSDVCNGPDPILPAEVDCYLCVNALLLFFRMLPQPVIPFDLCNSFMAHSSNASGLKKAWSSLPIECKATLSPLIGVLRACCELLPADDQRAGRVFAAKIFGNLIVRHRQDHDPSLLNWIGGSVFDTLSDVCYTLITHFETIVDTEELSTLAVAVPVPGRVASVGTPTSMSHAIAGGVSPRGPKVQVRGPSSSAGYAGDERSQSRPGARDISRMGQSELVLPSQNDRMMRMGVSGNLPKGTAIPMGVTRGATGIRPSAISSGRPDPALRQPEGGGSRSRPVSMGLGDEDESVIILDVPSLDYESSAGTSDESDSLSNSGRYDLLRNEELPPLPDTPPPTSDQVAYKNYMRLRYEYQERGLVKKYVPALHLPQPSPRSGSLGGLPSAVSPRSSATNAAPKSPRGTSGSLPKSARSGGSSGVLPLSARSSAVSQEEPELPGESRDARALRSPQSSSAAVTQRYKSYLDFWSQANGKKSKRYFVEMREGKLFFFKQETSRVPILVMDLLDCRVTAQPPLSFRLDTSDNKSMLLTAESTEHFIGWIGVLKNVMNYGGRCSSFIGQ